VFIVDNLDNENLEDYKGSAVAPILLFHFMAFYNSSMAQISSLDEL